MASPSAGRPALPPRRGGLRPCAAVLFGALLLATPTAGALEARGHAWQWRVLDTQAQVRDELLVTGPTAQVILDLPPNAHDVQAFVDGTAAPWEWTGPRTISVLTSRLLGDPTAVVALDVRYVVPASASGLALERTLTLDTANFSIRASLPDGWRAELNGQPLGAGDFDHLPAGTVVSLRLAPIPGPSPLLVLGALTLLILLGVMIRAFTARGHEPKAEMGLLDHLGELSGRVRKILLAVAVLMITLFTVGLQPSRLAGYDVALPVASLTDNLAAQTFRLIAQQFVPPGVALVVVDPISGAMVQVEVALFLALLVASPYIAYHVGSFLMPALMPHERRLLLRAIPAVTGLFVAGALFAYLLMVPTMMRVLYDYAQGLGAVTFLSVDSLVSFAIIVTLMFGAAFELPVVMVVVAKLGLVAPQTMAKYWRHATVAIFVAAAVITPDPSVVSQLLVALPMLGLYGVGLVAARAATRAPAREEASLASGSRP